MKYINYILLAFLFTLSCGCSKDEGTSLSKAVLASASSLSFDAKEADSKIITVYADADWVTECPDWVTVSPAQGNGTMDVTISVTDNMRDGATDNPRKATLVFKGATLASRTDVIVMQAGDKYRDCQEYQLSELNSLADETVVSIKNVLVSAITDEGFMATDTEHGSNMYMQGNATVQIGDKVSVKGSKATDMQSLTYVTVDEVQTVSTGNTITYPEAEDITKTIDKYNSTDRTYISVSGVLDGNKINISGATYAASISDATGKLKISELNGHNVTVKGYFAGVAAPVVKLMATEIEDKGTVETVYFFDDFEWVSPWAQAGNAGQTVENDDANAKAPNIFTTDGIGTEFINELEKVRGYTLVYRNASNNMADAVYLQSNYLKFGKTSFEAGITLPSISGIPAGEALTLSFDWCPMITGSHNFDNTKLAVVISEDGKDTEVAILSHSFVKTDKMAWLHANVSLSGLTITAKTKITIRTKEWDAANKSQRRWFLDNIKLKKTK